MLVVLASAADAAARWLVVAWRHEGARLLTPRDLSTAGWRVHPGAPQDGTAVVEGRIVEAAAIDGVVTRLPGVTSADVPWIVRADRAYVAEEMTAMLLAWLSELECPVVNRPSATGLWGPRLTPAQWAALAARAGMSKGSGDAGSPGDVTVTVAGDRCVGDAAGRLGQGARSLARAVGVPVLATRFDRAGAFLDAGYRAPVDDAAVADALLELLRGSPP